MARINTSGLKYASQDDGMKAYLRVREGSYERRDKRAYGSQNSDIAKVYEQKSVRMGSPEFIMLGATKLVDPTDPAYDNKKKISFAERESFNRSALSMPNLMRSRVEIPTFERPKTSWDPLADRWAESAKALSLDSLSIREATNALQNPPEKPQPRMDPVLGLRAPPRLALKGPQHAMKPLPPWKQPPPMASVAMVKSSSNAPLFLK